MGEHFIGEYKWVQLSMWDFAPKNGIQKFPIVNNTLTGKPMVLHYYLSQCTDIISDNHTKWRVVEKGEIVPEDVLNS